MFMTQEVLVFVVPDGTSEMTQIVVHHGVG